MTLLGERVLQGHSAYIYILNPVRPMSPQEGHWSRDWRDAASRPAMPRMVGQHHQHEEARKDSP